MNTENKNSKLERTNTKIHVNLNQIEELDKE